MACKTAVWVSVKQKSENFYSGCLHVEYWLTLVRELVNVSHRPANCGT